MITGEKLCICGGGGLGHTIAGTAATRGATVRILSPHAQAWDNAIEVVDINGKRFIGAIENKSPDSAEVIPGSTMVLLCVPGFLIRGTLAKIAPALPPSVPVGSVVSSTGFFFAAQEILPKGTPLFGLQRVPYISRVIEYGKNASLLGYKSQMFFATDAMQPYEQENLRVRLEALFETPTALLKTWWDVTLTNSNPILHPARLYGLWHDWKRGTIYLDQALFYEDWDVTSAETLIELDEDLFRVIRHYPCTPGAIKTLLDYYESADADTLAAKFRSIVAFKGIPAPMLKVDGGFVPDWNNRYFTEDFPFGLKLIQELGLKAKVTTPTIDQVMTWYETDVVHARLVV